MAAAAALLLVAAARAEETADTSVSVVTAEEIAREQPPDLMTLLRARVGLDNASGTLTMRGVQGIAVYVDGFVSSTDELAMIKPRQVARIEILRGAASARFGAGAMGGAILVTTEKRFATTEAELSQAVKGNGSHTTRVSGSRRDGPLNFGALGEYHDNRGHRAVPDAPFPGQITVEEEYSRSHGADLKVGYHGAHVETDLNLKHTRTKDGYGRPNWWWDRGDTTVRLTTQFKAVRSWDYRLGLGHEAIEDKALRDRGTGIDAAGLAADRYILSDQSLSEAEFAAGRRFESGTLDLAFSATRIAIAHRIEDFVTGEPEFTLDAKTLNTAAQFQYQGKPYAPLDVEIGGRYDRFHYYDTTIRDALLSAPIRGAPLTKEAFNPRLGLRWRARDDISLNTHLGTGFVPPDPEQLYYEDLGEGSQFLANPDLEPQRSWTWDLGIQRSLHGARLGLNFFYTHWDDKLGVLIVDYNEPVKRQWNNIGTAEAKGVELDWDQPLNGQWRLSFNYTFNHTEITAHDANPSLVGNELPYMPAHKANLALAYGAPLLNARAALRYVGATYTDERNTGIDDAGYDWRQDAYTVVDLTLTRPMGNARLTLAVDNLFDARYISGFFRESPGRMMRGEVAWRF